MGIWRSPLRAACRSVYGARLKCPFHLFIVQLIIQGLSSVRSIGYYKNLWDDKLCPFFNHSIFLPVLYLFLKKKRPDHTPYRRLNSPVAVAHSENFLIPSEVPKTSSRDSCLPNLDVILSLYGRAFGQLKGCSCVRLWPHSYRKSVSCPNLS